MGTGALWRLIVKRVSVLFILCCQLTTANVAWACWGPTCGDIFHPDGKYRVSTPEVDNLLKSVGLDADIVITKDDKCAVAVSTSVGGSMTCGGCLAASTASAGATAIACSNPCGVTAGALLVALKTCNLHKVFDPASIRSPLEVSHLMGNTESGFIKHGNNGATSCEQICRGAQWGRVGSCAGAFREDQGIQTSCDDAPGNLSSGELTCSCYPSEYKGGNNGTVSCTDWCKMSDNGPAGFCVAARRGDTGVNANCSDIPGFLSGPTHECFCQQ